MASTGYLRRSSYVTPAAKLVPWQAALAYLAGVAIGQGQGSRFKYLEKAVRVEPR